MIISASYKTDIPAFYGAWFMARIEAGFCRMINPYGQQVYEVPLGRAEVDGLVFWTRNVGPFLSPLRALRCRGYPFVVHFTMTGYPRALESSVIEAARAVEQIRTLAREFGGRVAVWRYDPILVTDLTPLPWHAENFARLAARVEGAVDEVVVSFAQIYRKTRRNLDAAARAFRFGWYDPGDGEKAALLTTLVALARRHGMCLTLCTQPAYGVAGAEPARCIDAGRLAALSGQAITARTKGNRPGCLCAESRDIGDYDSCPHGCVYCYAVRSPGQARRRYRAHDPTGAFLLEPMGSTDPRPPRRGSGAAR